MRKTSACWKALLRHGANASKWDYTGISMHGAKTRTGFLSIINLGITRTSWLVLGSEIQFLPLILAGFSGLSSSFSLAVSRFLYTLDKSILVYIQIHHY